MAPFRRPGLAEDDQNEVRPEVFRPRNLTKMPFHHPVSHIPMQAMFGDDEESVVSTLSTMSDLESLYVESSRKFHTHNPRDQYLLCQRLPGQENENGDGDLLGNEPAEKDSRGSSALLNGFGDGNNDDDDNWEDVIFAATNRPASSQRESKSKSSPKPKPKPLDDIDIDPVEQERIDVDRAIAESILQQAEDEMIRTSLMKEPRKEKRSSNKSAKKVATSDSDGNDKNKTKKPKKTRKEDTERIKVEKKTDRHVKNGNGSELKMGRHSQKENISKAPISPRRKEKAKKERDNMRSSFKEGLKTSKRTVQ